MTMPRFYPYMVFSGMNASVETVSVSRDNHLIVGGMAKQALYVWTLPSGELVQVLSDPNLHLRRRIIPASSPSQVLYMIKSAVITPDCSRVAAACQDAAVRVWELPSG